MIGCTVSRERPFGQQELTLSKATFTTRPSSVHSSAVACWVVAWHAHREMSTATTLPASPAPHSGTMAVVRSIHVGRQRQPGTLNAALQDPHVHGGHQCASSSHDRCKQTGVMFSLCHGTHWKASRQAPSICSATAFWAPWPSVSTDHSRMSPSSRNSFHRSLTPIGALVLVTHSHWGLSFPGKNPDASSTCRHPHTQGIQGEGAERESRLSCELKMSCDMLRVGTQASPSLQGPFMLGIEATLAGE